MRVVKIVLAAVAVVVVLVFAAVAIFASTFDPNDYKGLLTEQFTARTGRALTVDEDLRLAYFPWLAVETGGVTIGSADAFGGAQPFATARRVAARVKLLPLLSRRVEIGLVELDGLSLNLARDASLRGNWEDLLTRRGAAPAEPAGGGIEDLAIEGVRITDGSVYWRENSTELRYTVTGLTLTTGALGGAEPVAFDAALNVTDETSKLTAALAASAEVAAQQSGSVTATDVEASVTVVSGSAPPRTLEATAQRIAFDRAAETLAVEGLVTEMAGARAAWQVTGSTLIANPTLRGNVAVESADLETVFEQLQLAPPLGIDPSELGTLTLAGDFAFQNEPRTVQISALDAQLLGMRVTGDATLSGTNELAGHVVVGEFTPNAAFQALLRSTVPPTVDIGALGALALDARFDTTLDTGRAALRDLKLRALGAEITGTLEAIPGERGNVFRGEISTSRFAADAMATAFAALLPANLTAAKLGMIELAARFELDAGADALTLAPLRAEVFGLSARGELAARGVSSAATWTGTASVAEFSPQELLVRFGLPPQPTSDSQAFTRATVDTRFTVTNDGAELDGLTLSLDETMIKGMFALQGFDAPSYRFALEVDSVDADRYLPPKARDAQEGQQTAGDLELPKNNTMNLDGTMQIGSLKLAGLQFANVGSRVLIGGGNMTLENARAQLYGGDFAGSFHVRAAGDDPGLSLTGRASGLALEPLIAALTAEEPNFSGTGSFDLDLSGKGRTITENVQSAGGSASFEITEGAIKGFNLGRTLCSAYNATQGAAAPPEQPVLTAYEAIKGSATVAAGTATSNDLLGRTSYMDLSGAGSLHLIEQRLDYAFDAKLTAPIDIPSCESMDQFVGDELPFTIRGTVSEPEIMPDFSKLVQRQIREGIQERLQERIQDRLRDLLR